MAYVVKAFSLKKINLAPKTRVEEVLQNVAMILSTPKFSVPLDRGFGMAQRFIDKPIQTAQPILISEVLDVSFVMGDRPGAMIPIAEVNIIDGER